MANLCLEDIWRSRLTRLGWSPRAIDRFELSWARGTLRSYNNVLLQLYDYCHENDINFPPMKSAGLAKFFCVISSKSHRPQSILRTASAAIGHLYKAEGLENIVHDESLQRLITALIKSGTECPMKIFKCNAMVYGVKDMLKLTVILVIFGWDYEEHNTFECILLIYSRLVVGGNYRRQSKYNS